MKIEEIYNLNEGIKLIADKELPIKVAFLIQKNISLVESEIKNAEAIRQKIIEKYTDKEATEKIKDQGKIQLKEDKLDEFNREINELMDQEVEIQLKKITVDDLDGITIKPIELNQLRYVVKE